MAPCIRMSKSWCPRLANMMATPQSSSFSRRSRRSPSPSRAALARRCGWGQLLWPCAWAVTVVCASLHCAASAKHPPAIAPMLPPTLCTSCLPCVACACIPAGDTRVVSSQRSAAKSRVVWPCPITGAALGRPDQPSVVTLRCPTRPSRLALRPRYGELWVAAAARLVMIHAPCSCTACVAGWGSFLQGRTSTSRPSTAAAASKTRRRGGKTKKQKRKQTQAQTQKQQAQRLPSSPARSAAASDDGEPRAMLTPTRPTVASASPRSPLTPRSPTKVSPRRPQELRPAASPINLPGPGQYNAKVRAASRSSCCV